VLPKSRVSVTTTSSLDGWDIEAYLGPVVAHTVAGTGFISDWFASWSDVFGGRSGSYQKQLRSLSDEAVGFLSEKASERRANWVVGLTVDMDEISGQGKQMFMVTAMGTAVRAVRRQANEAVKGAATNLNRPSGQSQSSPIAGRLPADVVQVAAKRYALLERMQAGDATYNEDTWATLANERMADAAPFVIRAFAHVIKSEGPPDTPGQPSHGFLQHAVGFFDRLDAEQVKDALYLAVELHPTEALAASYIIKDLKLRDLRRVRRILTGPDVAARRRALQLMALEQRFYEPQDIEHLDAIRSLCEDDTTFPRIVTLIQGQGKGFFGSKDRLRCACDVERSVQAKYCPEPSCGKDERGFRDRTFTPDQATIACAQLSVTLNRAFAEMESAGVP
jgi:uncharacterized protein YbjQ (UPF0145 family)